MSVHEKWSCRSKDCSTVGWHGMVGLGSTKSVVDKDMDVEKLETKFKVDL